MATDLTAVDALAHYLCSCKSRRPDYLHRVIFLRSRLGISQLLGICQTLGKGSFQEIVPWCACHALSQNQYFVPAKAGYLKGLCLSVNTTSWSVKTIWSIAPFKCFWGEESVLLAASNTSNISILGEAN